MSWYTSPVCCSINRVTPSTLNHSTARMWRVVPFKRCAPRSSARAPAGLLGPVHAAPHQVPLGRQRSESVSFRSCRDLLKSPETSGSSQENATFTNPVRRFCVFLVEGGKPHRPGTLLGEGGQFLDLLGQSGGVILLFNDITTIQY